MLGHPIDLSLMNILSVRLGPLQPTDAVRVEFECVQPKVLSFYIYPPRSLAITYLHAIGKFSVLLFYIGLGNSFRI
jgi:hypothetical protein